MKLMFKMMKPKGFQPTMCLGKSFHFETDNFKGSLRTADA